MRRECLDWVIPLNEKHLRGSCGSGQRRRMRRHSKVHLTTGMIQDHRDVKDLKAKSRNREKVHSPGHLQVVFSCPKIAGGGQASQRF